MTMLRSVPLACAVAMAILIAPGPTPAADKPEQVDEMVVTAGRVEEKKKNVTFNMTIITEDQIRRSTATNIGELLFKTGAAAVRQYPGVLSPIGIRGFRTDTHGGDLQGRILVLVNGRRTGTGNLAKISTNNVERVEVLHGPSSVQYGTAGIGGTVNIITRRGKEGLNAFAEGKLGSWQYHEYGAGLSGKAKKLDFSAAASTAHEGDYQTADGTQYLNTGIERETNINANFGYEFAPGNRIGLIASSFEANGVGAPNYIDANDPDDYKDTSLKSTDIIYDGVTGDGHFQWRVHGYTGKDISTDWTVAPPALSTASQNETEFEGASGQVSWDADIIALTGGVDWVHYHTYSSPWSPKETEYDNPAGVLLAKARLLEEKLIFSGGMRYDDYSVKIHQNQGSNQSIDNTAFQAGAAYHLMPVLKIRANWGQGFAMPSAQQLAYNITSWGTTTLGNPNLQPVESTTYDGGLDYSANGITASGTYFYTDYRNKIEVVTIGPGLRSYVNTGKSTLSGFEGNLSWDLGTTYSWDYSVVPRFGFTYLTKYKDEQTDADLKYTPESIMNFGVGVSNYDDLLVDLNFAYYGKEIVDDWYLAGPPTWTAPVVTKGSFTIADLVVEKRLARMGAAGDLTLRGEINNLLNEEYAYVQRYPGPGRSFVLGLRWDY